MGTVTGLSKCSYTKSAKKGPSSCTLVYYRIKLDVDPLNIAVNPLPLHAYLIWPVEKLIIFTASLGHGISMKLRQAPGSLISNWVAIPGLETLED